MEIKSELSTERMVIGLNLVLILVLMASFAVGLEGSGDGQAPPVEEVEEVTFVAAQGGSAQLYPHAGSMEAVHTPSKEVVWSHDEYRRYMDVDPLNDSTILFLAGNTSGEEVTRIVSVYNWREDKELYTFEVPHDTHDVDRMEEENLFAVADKANARLYIYNRSSDTITWEYDFYNHFEHGVDGGPGTHEFTHMNDVEVVMKGSALMASPRNFDRVFLINRSSKEIIFELGEEDNYSILYEQHNPDLLSTDPYTVIVSDSENDRIIEYQKDGENWEKNWVYSEGLTWPRDGDRLPNGNTLIVDTANARVLEVTPEGETVWEYSTDRSPYDVERLGYGDESSGGPMEDGNFETKEASLHVQLYNNLYSTGSWILPPGTGKTEFSLLLLIVSLNAFYGVSRVREMLEK